MRVRCAYATFWSAVEDGLAGLVTVVVWMV